MATLNLTLEQLTRACTDAVYLESLAANPDAPVPRTKRLHGEGLLSTATRFHHCADEFVRWLANDGRDMGGNAETVSSELWRELFQRFARPEIEALAEGGMIQDAAQLSAAFQAFCERLLSLREAIPDIASWNNLLAADPIAVLHEADAGNGQRLEIRGIINGLRRRPDGAAEMVDYRFGGSSSIEDDLVSFAIKSWLLKTSPHALIVHGVIEGYAPDEEGVNLDAVEAVPEQLDAVFEQSVRPVLERLAGAELPHLK